MAPVNQGCQFLCRAEGASRRPVLFGALHFTGARAEGARRSRARGGVDGGLF